MKRYFKRFIEKYSQTVGERTEVDEMMALTFVIQSAFWHNVLDPKWTWRRYFIYHLLNLALIIYVFFGTMDIVNNTTNFQIIAEAYFTIILIVSSPIKVLIFAHNRFIYRKLYLTTKTTFYNLIKSDSEQKLKKVLQTGTKVIYTLFILMAIPVVQMLLIALWNYAYGTRVPLSRSTNTLMPMTSPYYEIAYVLHSVFLGDMAGIFITINICFVFLLYFLCVASDTLLKMLHVEPKRSDESDLSYGERLNDGLRKFYYAHLDIVKYENALNQMYKWLALVPLCNSALCICIALVVLSKEVNLQFVTLLFPLLGEIFTYSWFGEQLKTKASNINTALFNYDWTSMELKHRKNYYILIVFMSKEFGIRTAIGHNLSLITMTSVLKFSYQAFTVLNTME